MVGGKGALAGAGDGEVCASADPRAARLTETEAKERKRPGRSPKVGEGRLVISPSRGPGTCGQVRTQDRWPGSQPTLV